MPTASSILIGKGLRDMVFFVSGIGCAPAVAVARNMLITPHAERHIFVHVTDKGSKQPYRNEMSLWSGSVTATLHDTELLGRPTAGLFAQIARDHEDSDFYICGSSAFENVVRAGLNASGEHTGRVRILAKADTCGAISGHPVALKASSL